jgi:hypothetical protein
LKEESIIPDAIKYKIKLWDRICSLFNGTLSVTQTIQHENPKCAFAHNFHKDARLFSMFNI